MILANKQKCLDIINTLKKDEAILFFSDNELSTELSSDKDLAKAMVILDGSLIKKFSDSVKDDEVIVRMGSIPDDGGWFSSLGHASLRLQNDPTFIASLVLTNSRIFPSIKRELKYHPEVLEALYRDNINRFASYVLKTVKDHYSETKTAEEMPEVTDFLKFILLNSNEYVKQFKDNVIAYGDYKNKSTAVDDGFQFYDWPLAHCLERMSSEDLKLLPLNELLPDVNVLINNQRQKNAIYALKQKHYKHPEKKVRKSIKLT